MIHKITIQFFLLFLLLCKILRMASSAIAPIVGEDVAVAATKRRQKVDQITHQDFASSLTSNLYKNENEFTSTLGISMAFSLIYPGCNRKAIRQISNVLGFPSGKPRKKRHMQLLWEKTTNRLLGNANGKCLDSHDHGACRRQTPLMEIANSVWLDDRDSLNIDYEVVLGDYALQIDFRDDESPKIINKWVENKTNGLIDSIVPERGPLYPPWELIIINSIYLKASWEHQFQPQKTNVDSFYSSIKRNAEVSTAHFMHGVLDHLDYSHSAIPNYQIARLPFAASKISMIVALPMKDNADVVLESDLLLVLDDLTPTDVALSLPKFRFESTYDDDLKQAIMKLGIVAPFSAGSLCHIFENDDECGLFIGEVIQKTLVDVNENGVEAAAVTAKMFGRSIGIGEPTLMMCDHPFQIFIRDRGEDMVIFEGRVGRPKEPESEPEEPLLSKKHSEEDFWQSTFGIDPTIPSPIDDDFEGDNEADESIAMSTNALENIECTSIATNTLKSSSVWMIALFPRSCLCFVVALLMYLS